MTAMSEPSMPPTREADQRYAGVTAHVMLTVKGGAGKTETADVLEAALTLFGQRCLLIDIDDGNRGLSRRVGSSNVVKLGWESGASDAPDWVATHVNSIDDLIFDLGAGISSSDTPVMACLASIWRILSDGGGKVIFYCIVSTNAPTAGFIERVASSYGRFASLVIVWNNQDNSRQFSSEVSATYPKINLDHLAGGLQAVRLMRREPLSGIIRGPTPGYELASAMIAARVNAFAAQMQHTSIGSPRRGELLARAAAAPVVMFAIRRASLASNERILENAQLLEAHRHLLAPVIDDVGLVARAQAYRQAYRAYRSPA
jgi:hypothetical protein